MSPQDGAYSSAEKSLLCRLWFQMIWINCFNICLKNFYVEIKANTADGDQILLCYGLLELKDLVSLVLSI